MLFFQLFYTFLKIGLFSFGGGYAMIALIQDEVVSNHAWMTMREFTDLVAVSQTTPGPVGINSATYAGYTAVMNAGYPQWTAVAGSLLASISVVLIPVLLVLLVGHYLQAHKDNPLVAVVLRVVRLAVVGLIAAAALSLMTAESFGTPALSRQFITSVLIFAAVFVASYFYKKSPIMLILAAGVVGLIVYSL